DYIADARPAGSPDRRAVAVASDDPEARQRVAALVDDLGFEPVPVPFDRAGLLEPGGPVFGTWLDVAGMREVLAAA
ncbi:MAG: NADP oxidoreductase, partial [Brooklawnia sp.]